MTTARLFRAALIPAIATAAVVLSAPAASADIYCTRSEYCVYQHSGFYGDAYTTPYSNIAYTHRMSPINGGVGVLLDNQVSSWQNVGWENSLQPVVHSYRDFWGAGGELWYGRPWWSSHWVGWANDQASSHYWKKY